MLLSKAEMLARIDELILTAPFSSYQFPRRKYRSLRREYYSIKCRRSQSDILAEIREIERIFDNMPRVTVGSFRIINTQEALSLFRRKVARTAAKYFPK